MNSSHQQLKIIRSPTSRESLNSSRSYRQSSQYGNINIKDKNRIKQQEAMILRPTSRNQRISESRSSMRSQFSSRSNKGWTIQGLEQVNIQSIGFLIDDLLEQRLRYLTNLEKADEREIMKVNQALCTIKAHLLSRQLDQTQENHKEQISSKLEIIDKILAETTVESEILRQRYFNLINNRTTFGRFFTLNRSCSNLKTHMSNESFKLSDSVLAPKISVVKDTSYKTSFSAPKKQLISLFRQSKKKYSYNLFPVASSSYKLNYRPKQNVAPFPKPVKQQTFNAFKQYYPRGMSQSLYTSDFHSKSQSEYINYKDQDCYKDKFRTLKLQYDPKKYSIKSPMNTLARLQKQYSSLLTKPRTFQKTSSLKQHFNTTTSKDFKGIFQPRTVGKYEQLRKLKINYKNLVNLEKNKH